MFQPKRISAAVPTSRSLWLSLATPAAMTVLAALLTGCDSGTSPAEPPGGVGDATLTQGDYFIQSDADDSYHYDQYFVVQPGGRWEFIEYGYDKTDKTNLCQITRQGGTYSATDSTLTAVLTQSGKSVEKCHMTVADFQAYPLVNVPERPTQTFHIRNVAPSGFEGEDLFIDNSGWKLYARTEDPYGFY